MHANGESLNIKYTLNKGHIQNNDYCFKNMFLIVQNIAHDLILGTPFLTQIYPIYVNESGVHTQILGKQISFNFLCAPKWCIVWLFQNSSIYKQVNLLRLKQNQQFKQL